MKKPLSVALIVSSLALCAFAAEPKTIYVDAENGLDTNDGTTELKAVKTLQKAVSKASNAATLEEADTIIALPGDYDEGSGNTTHWWGGARVVVQSKSVKIISRDGAAVTRVIGKKGNDVGGLGLASQTASPYDDSLRCFIFWPSGNGKNPCILQGFTLCDAATQNNAALPRGGGAAVFASVNGSSTQQKQIYVMDCVISNCACAGYGPVVGGTYLRCKFVANDFIGGNYPYLAGNPSVFVNSVFTDNRRLDAAGAEVANGQVSIMGSDSSYFINCTFVGNKCVFRPSNLGVQFYNVLTENSEMRTAGAGQIISNVVVCAESDGYTPRVAAGDFRIRGGTSIVTAGNALHLGGEIPALDFPIESGVDPYLDFYTNSIPSEGAIAVGASQAEVVGAYLDPNGYLTTADGATGFVAAEAGETIDVVFKAGSPTPIAGICVNGVTNLCDESQVGVAKVTVSVEADVTTQIRAVDGETGVWYVDAVNGDDTLKFGYNAACAFKTLTKAMENRKSGEKVIALPGVYKDGGAKHNATKRIASRVVIPNGVTLESRDGRDVTTIEGEDATYQDVATYTIPATFDKTGMGPDAKRGAYLMGANSVLRGFTVTKGRVCLAREDGSTGHSDDDTVGAGVLNKGTCEDCWFTGNRAYRAAGGREGTFVNCVFDGNDAIYGGGGTDSASNYGCLFKNNKAHDNTGYAGMFYWNVAENCTVLDGASDPLAAATSRADEKGVFRNCLILGRLMNAANRFGNACIYANSAFASDASGMSETWKAAILSEGGNNIVKTKAEMAVDEEGRPIVGMSPAIDAANASLNVMTFATDALGGQRIYNNALDIGALEGDWRARYAQDLSRTLVGLQASPEVAETDGKVRLTDGTTFAALYTRVLEPTRQIKHLLNTTVSGTGALSVSVDGQLVATLTEGSSTTEILLGADSQIDFAFEGEGFADIGRMLSGSGAFFFVR